MSRLAKVDLNAAALVVQFFVSIAFSLMGSFLPLFIRTELGETLIQATYWTGVVQLASSSLMAATAPFWGSMCDRFGTKRIMMNVLIANVVVYAGMALSTSVHQIILFRGMQGSLGGMSTVMFTLAASTARAGDLRRVLSYQMATQTLGSIIGPGIGALLAAAVGFRWAFATSSLLFASIAPIVYLIPQTPPPDRRGGSDRFRMEDLRGILPDAASLLLVYASISFIGPAIPWFFESFGVPSEQLIGFTALANILNGLAFVAAAPLLTKLVSERTLPLLSLASSGAILLTALLRDPYQFLAARVAIGGIQAGVPPSLIGGRSGRKGMTIGFMNSARSLGQALGPFVATSILGDGAPPRSLYMFGTMAVVALAASIVIYLTHTRGMAVHHVGEDVA